MRRLAFCIAVVSLIMCFTGSTALADKDPRAAVMTGASPDLASMWGDEGVAVCWDNPQSIAESSIIQYMVWQDAPGTLSQGDAPLIALPGSALQSFMGFDHMMLLSGWPIAFTYYGLNKKGELYLIWAEEWGIQTGVSHKYWVSALCRSNNQAAKKANYQESKPIYAGQATYLSRPVCDRPGGLSPTEYVLLDYVTFMWYGSQAADQYVIEVSPTPGFQREATWVGKVDQPTNVDYAYLMKTFVGVLSEAPELSNLPGGSTLYWRVGARNSQDDIGPVPAGPSPAADGEKDTRYIYSQDVFGFMTLADIPPPPPDDGGDDDGGDVPPHPPPPPI